MRVLVTGSSTGIGEAVADRCAGGHAVVRHARSDDRADQVRAAHPGADVVVGDLTDAASTDGLARQMTAFGGFDAVVHNAGWASPGPGPELTADGVETTVAVNLLAVARLLSSTPLPARVVHVSSDAFRDADQDAASHLRLLADPHAPGWSPDAAYASSKLAATALVLALARRRPDVVAVSVHPGWVRTRMSAGTAAPLTVEQGGDTPAWLATSPEVGPDASGGFFIDRQRQDIHPLYRDEEFQEHVVALCEQLTGLPFPAR